MSEAKPGSQQLRLITFGGISVRTESGEPLTGAATRRKPLSVLAVIAVAGPMGVSRDRLAALFWPESSEDHARNALKQTIFALRRDLKQSELVLGTADIRLNAAAISSDIYDFRVALDQGNLERAAELYTAPFLEGVHLRESAEFERWVEGERSRLADEAALALTKLARSLSDAGQHERAIRWWRRLAQLKPADPRVALNLMKSLASSGDRGGALQHAKAYAAYLSAELGEEPNDEVVAFAKSLRRDGTARPKSGDPAEPTVFAVTRQSDVEPERLETPLPAPGSILARRRVLAGAAVFLTLGVLIAATLLATKETKAKSPIRSSTNVLLIAPFHVEPRGRELDFLRDGMVDLLSATLTDDAGRWRVAEPAAFLPLWHDTGSSATNASKVRATFGLARNLGATRMVSGTVVGGPTKVFVTASLFDVANGKRVGSAEVSGSLDSLPTLVDRLAAQILALQMGERSASVAVLTGSSLPAVRSYLDGRASFRIGAYPRAVELHKRALLLDSTFALPAIELGRISGWLGDDESRRMGYERAWANRKRLGPIDRAVVMAMLGPRYPHGSSRAEWLAAWEHVAAIQPEQPDGWYEAGDLLFHNPWLGTATDQDGLARAKMLFLRALEQGPTYVPALQHLIQLAAHEGDTATIRNLAAKAASVPLNPDLDAYLRWRIAIALGDSSGVRAAWIRLQKAGPLALQWVAMTSQEDGIAQADAVRAVDWRLSKAVTDGERVDALMSKHAIALNRGEVRNAKAAAAALRSTNSGAAVGHDLQILDVLYGGLSEDSTFSQAIRETEALGAVKPKSSQQREQWTIDRCFLGHWYLSRNNLQPARKIVADMEDIRARHAGEMWSSGAGTCALLLDAWIAVRARDPNVGRKLELLDKTLADGPYVSSRLLWDVTVAASANLFEAAGDLPKARSASRRRNWFYRWPHYLAAQRRIEGGLAARTGNVPSATNAYRHYLSLRVNPEGEMVSERERVRAALASLGQP